MPSAAPPRARPAGYAAARWDALGTYVALVVADGHGLDAARLRAEAVLDAVDRSCSRFRDDSDLVRVNAAAGRWIRVDSLLVRALAAAVDAAVETDGLVDPTLGVALNAVGYDRDFGELATRSDADLASAVPFSLPVPTPDAWRAVELDPEGAVRIPAGVALDLGATGKAFAADLVAAEVSRATGSALVVSLGGDVATATGDDGARHPWQVAVAERPDEGGAEVVVLDDGGMATSSTVHRRWTLGGREQHHLLDPRTGRPVRRNWRTASVVAETCLAANTASTAAIMLGARAPEWLEERDLAARLVHTDGHVLRVAGWPEPPP